MNKPRIYVGIAEICPKENSRRDVSVFAAYAESVAKGGNVPVVIPRYAPGGDFGASLERIDLLLVTGGPDISPERYGEKTLPGTGPLNPVRDRFEFALVAAARKAGTPILGICRGCQLLNVAFGGTLRQELPEGGVKYHRKTRHRITIDDGSLLGAMVGEKKPIVNSSHHQCVREPALGFDVVARAPDGTIEAIESKCYRAMGLQFHPERLVSFGHNALWNGFFSRLSMLV